MIIITILQNFTKLIFWLINIFNFIKFLKTKQLKNIFLLILFYLFLNLYLFPTNALCEIDPNLLDRENNTYKGSKIVYETPDEIVTKKEVEDAQETMYIVQGVIIWFMFAARFYAYCCRSCFFR